MSVAAKLRAGVVGAAFVGAALTPLSASAITVVGPINALGGGDIDGGYVNLLDDDVFVLSAFLGGDGSITFHTYVDPKTGTGSAVATVLLEPLGDVDTAFASWGGGTAVSLTSGSDVVLSTVFSLSGSDNAQDFVVSWTGATGLPSFTANVAAVTHAPIPPAIALFAPVIAAAGAGSWWRRRRLARSGAASG